MRQELNTFRQLFIINRQNHLNRVSTPLNIRVLWSFNFAIPYYEECNMVLTLELRGEMPIAVFKVRFEIK